MKKIMFAIVFLFYNTSFTTVPTNSKTTLMQLSRSCIKIWSLMRDLVDNGGTPNNDLLAAESSGNIDLFDTILCKMVRVRDMIKSVNFNSATDAHSTVYYIDSSLDCIGQYTYDLVKQYPGSWSSVIQEQVFRAQEAYAQSIMQQITN